jgi:hypothetical protein
MKRFILISMTLIVAAFYVNSAIGQDVIVFPAKGQSANQMEKDKFDCYQWAKQQTGFDPMQSQQAVQAPPPQSQGPQGERVRGAARGAAVGAATGAIAGDAEKGAAAGAVGGAMVGGMRKRQQRREQAQVQEQQAQQQASASEAQRSTYNRAYSACLEGKGYTVK